MPFLKCFHPSYSYQYGKKSPPPTFLVTHKKQLKKTPQWLLKPRQPIISYESPPLYSLKVQCATAPGTPDIHHFIRFLFRIILIILSIILKGRRHSTDIRPVP